MKILILSCHTGEGHNSAAKAMHAKFLKEGHFCETLDALSFSGEKSKRVVTSSYNSMIVKAPELFGWIYKAGNLYRSTKLTSPVYFANSLYAKNMLAYIKEHGFEAILCTHLFPMEALTYLRKKGLLDIPCYGILTDYTCIPFFEETQMDGYFLPHMDLILECVEKGMKKEHLFATGIPVRENFLEDMTCDTARNYLMIPQDKKVLLMMTGGMGCGNTLELCKKLAANQSENMILYILCGRNDSLKESIQKTFANDSRIQPVIFTEKVNIYMKAADVVLSKAGGISSTEVATANIPFVHIMPLPGCETRNAQFFASKGMSFYAKTFDEAILFANRLIDDNVQSENMCKLQKEQINAHAAEDIMAHIVGA